MDIQTARALSTLLPNSPSAQIDVDWLIARRLNIDYSSLKYRQDRSLSPQEKDGLLSDILRRQAGEPIAYILGDQGFWSLDLKVSPSTLIPRPDTESLVETILDDHGSESGLKVLDLGTGTGAIALALAKENPTWQVLGVDLQPEAVALAQENAVANAVHNARFIESSWFDQVQGDFDIIVSNPPYIREDDEHLNEGDVRFEPRSALVAKDNGLADIRHITVHAPSYLNESGELYFEHGYDQAEQVRSILSTHGFVDVVTIKDLGGNDRVTKGRLAS